MTFHQGGTLVTEIDATDSNAPFSPLDTVHFARWVILYERQDISCNSDGYPPSLLLRQV